MTRPVAINLFVLLLTEADATAAIVASTFAFVATAGLWLAVLSLT